MPAYRPKILAIDDTPANLMMLASALSGEFAFQLAASGPSGLEMSLAAPPDLILLDVMMPEVDGFETCRRIKADPRLRHIPVIFITALSDISSEVDGLSLGAADFIHKPINIDIARQRIRNLLERESLRRQVEAHRDRLEEEVALRTQDLRKLNEDLRVALDAAEVASRTKSDFLANMSHEVRTPLNIMLGQAELLHLKISDPFLLTKVDRIKQAGHGLLGIFEQIMQIARMGDASEVARQQDFVLADLLDAAEAHVRPQAEAKNLTLAREVGPAVPAVLKGDPARLRQALDNFLGNALKFSQQGCITIRVHVADVGEHGPRLRFEVQDEGIGIAEDQIDKLFRPFVQGDASSTRQHGGLGIGLAINKYLAGLMGGEVGVRSTPGRGSRFWITLPMAVGQAAAVTDSRLAGIEAAELPGVADASAQAASPVDVGQAAQSLARLLEGSDVDALSIWKQNQALLAPLLETEISAFQQALDAFDFPAALALMRRALQRHPELEPSL